MNIEHSIFDSTVRLSEAELNSEAKYILYENKLEKIQNIKFKYKLNTVKLYITTNVGFHCIMLYQRYGHIYNSKNYNNRQIAVYLFSTKENAIKYIKKELTKHNKLLKKYKQAYINKKEYLNKFNKIKLQYPEYFL